MALVVNGNPGEPRHTERFQAVTEAIYEDLGLTGEVHDRDDQDLILADLVDHTIRETTSPATTSPWRHLRPGAGEGEDPRDRALDLLGNS